MHNTKGHNDSLLASVKLERERERAICWWIDIECSGRLTRLAMIWSVHYGWADSVPPLARLCTAELALGAGGRLGHTTHCWRTASIGKVCQEGKPQGISHFKTLHHITSELEIPCGALILQLTSMYRAVMVVLISSKPCGTENHNA